MLKIELSFQEAINMLVKKTYLTESDAEKLLKGIFQIQMQEQQGNNLFKKGEVAEMFSDVESDKDLFYLKLKIPYQVVERLVTSVMKTLPDLNS